MVGNCLGVYDLGEYVSGGMTYSDKLCICLGISKANVSFEIIYQLQ